MTEKMLSEEEQLAFFDAVHGRFLDASRAAGTESSDYRLAGTTFRLLFAGQGLTSRYRPAFEHLRVSDVEKPDATLCLWDTKHTGIRMVPPPCPQDSFTDRGDIWGFHSKRIKTAFHYHDYSVNLFDLDRGLGIHWVSDGAKLPYWDGASPIRTLLHWLMESRGCQLLHAAAVGTEHGAMLITGKGGVGKSSTALACLRAGLPYAGDDYVVVRRDPPTVYSLYSTAKLNPPDVERFPELRPYLGDPNPKPNEKAVLYLYPHFKEQIMAEMPLKAIAMPRIVNREETGLRPAATATVRHAASFTTMSQLPCVGKHTHEFFGALCSSLPGYTIELGSNRPQIPTAITNFLRNGARRESAAPSPSPESASSPLVTVIIPAWNAARFLPEAIENILSQNYPALEIIVVDDGSTDNTAAVVKDLPCDVRYFRQENSGPAAARNRGIRDSSGDLIAFLDSDDLWSEDHLQLLVRAMMDQPELDVVHGHAQILTYVPASGSYVYTGNPEEAFPYYIGAGLYRKRVFEKVGVFDRTLRFGEDTDWYTRAQEKGARTERLDFVTLLVRRHGENMTEDRREIELSMLRVFKKALDRKRTPDPTTGAPS
jgi:GT2 family glycosyltransferase